MHKVTFILLVIGGLNWLLVGVFGADLFTWIFSDAGMSHIVSRIVYVLVGLSAIVEVATHKKNCKACMAGPSKKMDKGMGGEMPAGGQM